MNTTQRRTQITPASCGLLLTLLLISIPLACGGPRGPKPRKPTVLNTDFDDSRAGAEAAESMAQQMGLVEDPELNAYVTAIGKRMVKFAPRRPFEYTFHIVDQSAPNAFALPGGYIYVSRGLLTLVNSEDELACVIGHEITHAAERHAAARQEYGKRISPFSIGYLRAAQLAAYGRNQERDADRGGQLLAARAGWNPMGMATFMQDLEAMSRLTTGWSRLPGYFDSHPSSPERAATSATRAQNLKWVPQPHIAKNHMAFLEEMSGLVVGDDPKEGIFEGTRFLHRDMDFSLRFPDGWQLINQRDLVGAFQPIGPAFIAMRIEGAGDDPRAMAKKIIETELFQARAKVRSETVVQVGEYPGYRLEIEAGMAQTGAIITLFAYDDHIFRIDTVARAGQLRKFVGRGRAVVRSFRPLTNEEKGLFETIELEIVEAGPAETLPALSARTNNQLDLGTTAVLNDLFIDARLNSGQPIKIGRGLPYEPESESTTPLGDLEKATSTAPE